MLILMLFAPQMNIIPSGRRHRRRRISDKCSLVFMLLFVDKDRYRVFLNS